METIKKILVATIVGTVGLSWLLSLTYRTCDWAICTLAGDASAPVNAIMNGVVIVSIWAVAIYLIGD